MIEPAPGLCRRSKAAPDGHIPQGADIGVNILPHRLGRGLNPTRAATHALERACIGRKSVLS